ncbi:MAG: YggT family protein [Acidimicrobiales bacterium]
MIIEILIWICILFLVALWARMILSYLSVMPGAPLESLNRLAISITEPVLRPVRRLLPPQRVGAGVVDLSPLVVSLAVIIVITLL